MTRLYSPDFSRSAIDPRQCLYVSDMDGTLLSPDSSFADDAVRRLNRLIDRGLKFTIATARNYDSAYPLLRNVKLNIPVILFNGVYLTELHTGKNMQMSSFISVEVIEEMVAAVVPQGIDPFIYTYGEKHKIYYRNVTNPGSRNYVETLDGGARLHRVPEYQIHDSENVSGLLMIDTHTTLEPIYREFSQKYVSHLNMYFAEDIAMPGYYWLQIFHQHANKGRMVEALAARMNIPLSHVVVFGDYLNDLDMFKIAGQAIAVGNALPEVKAAAHRIIGSNETCAVIEYLETLGFDK